MKKFLTGIYEVALDEAGRIAVPRYLRTILGKNGVVLTKGADPCIWLYTAEDWEERVEVVLAKTDYDTEDDRDIRRHYLGYAHPLDMDKQGRVLVPSILREYAGLSKECFVLGQHDYIEIWDKERYKAYECSQEEFRKKSEAFARMKKEGKNAGNSAHSGVTGRSDTLPRSEGQG